MKNRKILLGCLLGLFAVAAVLLALAVTRQPGADGPGEAAVRELFTSREGAQPDDPQPEQSTDAPVQQVTHVIKHVTEPLVIDSKASPVQGVDIPTADDVDMGWEGEMEFTVTRAVLYHDLQKARPGEEIMTTEERFGREENLPYLELDLMVRNLSARDLSEDIRNSGYHMSMMYVTSKKEFQRDEMNMRDPNILLNIAYFSDHDADDKSYFRFDLPQGETLETKLGFFVTDALVEEELVLRISFSQKNQFAILLNEWEVVR